MIWICRLIFNGDNPSLLLYQRCLDLLRIIPGNQWKIWNVTISSNNMRTSMIGKRKAKFLQGKIILIKFEIFILIVHYDVGYYNIQFVRVCFNSIKLIEELAKARNIMVVFSTQFYFYSLQFSLYRNLNPVEIFKSQSRYEI